MDLVFYNRLLRCFVLFDLKIGELKHQDIGQMQMYVHYYDRKVKLPEENPTIGIILCKDKNNAVVEMTPTPRSSPASTKRFCPARKNCKSCWKNSLPNNILQFDQILHPYPLA